MKVLKEYKVELKTPNSGTVTGMGIPKGITLIVGGGYHGKSTLINAISEGIYDHIPSDGREKVVTIKNSSKIKAEEGRPVNGTNIEPFINNLPNNKQTDNFYTNNASGSTSQASSLVEALDSDCKLIIIDEDTSATNFLIRDYRMSLLTEEKDEPITPLLSQIENLNKENDVSFLMVMGGNSQYFESAENVIQMKNYKPVDVIENVKYIIKNNPIKEINSAEIRYKNSRIKFPLEKVNLEERGRFKPKVENFKSLILSNNIIDISALEVFKENGQLIYISHLIRDLKSKYREIDYGKIEAEIKENLILDIDQHREFSEVRDIDLALILNRIRY